MAPKKIIREERYIYKISVNNDHTIILLNKIINKNGWKCLHSCKRIVLTVNVFEYLRKFFHNEIIFA